MYKNLFLKKEDKEFFKALKSILRFSPKNIVYYKRALTHKSIRVKNNFGITVNNERLEFLGDSVLDTVVADYLFNKFPLEDEGFLTNLRSKIVKRKHLDLLASKIGIDIFVKSGIRISKVHSHVFGNALEALIGAIYLDKGYKYSKKFIINNLIKNHIDIDELMMTEENFKSRLIEYIQKEKLQLVFDTNDNKNKKGKFISKVIINDELISEGKGTSKKEAEQNAAKNALLKINN